VTSAQRIGTPIKWTVTATDSNSGPLTFQFNVAPPGVPLALFKDFNAGTLNLGTWTAQPFAWVPTGVEGTYQIQVVIKDFTSGETASKTLKFQVNPLVTGSTPVVVATANPLVALFSAPSCAAGSTMRVSFQPQSLSTPATTTNWMQCHPPATMTFEIAGMYPSTTYTMFWQTNDGSSTTNGPSVNFTTGALPTGISFPAFNVTVPAGSQTDQADSVILINVVEPGVTVPYLDVATDLSGNIIWFYGGNLKHYSLLARPLQNGTMLTIQNGPAWNPATQGQQVLRQIDLAGNTIRETNTGIIQQQLLSMGATDGQSCKAIPSPAPVGSACLGAFHHDAIQTLPNGDTAILADIEKILPPGTQGDTSGLPVDIVGDMIIVLNAGWQVVWYWDAFQHDSGPPQLDINRPSVLGKTCANGSPGCPPILLLGAGIAPQAKDWLHANTIYYWPQTTDIIWSSRNQDWVMKIDYKDGGGTGNILWRMGPEGDFTFNNVFNDPWPWFSGQHDVGMENNGAGPMTIFDNGNTRISPPPLGLGAGNSRCMALTFDETTMQVTPPVSSVDLGVFSTAMGSAQLLSNGDLYCFPAIVVVTLNTLNSRSIELSGGTQVLNIQGPEGYRGWRMPSLYAPPIT
jgi:arylsulfate sulfotransferase